MKFLLSATIFILLAGCSTINIPIVKESVATQALTPDYVWQHRAELNGKPVTIRLYPLIFRDNLARVLTADDRPDGSKRCQMPTDINAVFLTKRHSRYLEKRDEQNVYDITINEIVISGIFHNKVYSDFFAGEVEWVAHIADAKIIGETGRVCTDKSS